MFTYRSYDARASLSMRNVAMLNCLRATTATGAAVLARDGADSFYIATSQPAVPLWGQLATIEQPGM
jgi:hypothetical protein